MSSPTIRKPITKNDEASMSTMYVDSDTGEPSLTDDELFSLVQEMQHDVKILSLENEILEKSMARLDPSLLIGLQQVMDNVNTAINTQRIHSSFNLSMSKVFRGFPTGDSLPSPSTFRFTPSKTSTKKIDSSAKFTGRLSSSTPKINIIERSELVQQVINSMLLRRDRVKHKAAKKHAFLKAGLEEVGIKLTDTENAMIMFERDVITNGWDKIAQRIPAEIWIRCMSEWLKITDKQIGKLRLRTSTLNTKHGMLKGQIKTKTELKEQLTPIDFDKMRIHNEECLKLIDQKAHVLVELKQMTGEANLFLTTHKGMMLEKCSYLNKVQNSIKDRQKQTVKLNKEKDIIQIEADNLSDKLDDVRRLRNKYEVPNPMNYIEIKSEIDDLKGAIKRLEIRKRIHCIALASIHEKIRRMTKESNNGTY